MNFLKRFKSSDVSLREVIIGEWIPHSLRLIGNYAGLYSPVKLRKLITELDIESDRFCAVDIIEDWKLVKGWFRNILAQTSTHPATKRLFDMLCWNYESHLNPKYDEMTTVITIEIKEISGNVPVNVVVKPSGNIQLYSSWINVRSGLSWKIIDRDNSGFIMEMKCTQNKRICNISRKQHQLQKYWKKVN